MRPAADAAVNKGDAWTMTHRPFRPRMMLAAAAAALLSLPPAAASADVESADPIKLTLHDWTGQLITTTLMGEVLKRRATPSTMCRRTTSLSSQG